MQFNELHKAIRYPLAGVAGVTVISGVITIAVLIAMTVCAIGSTLLGSTAFVMHWYNWVITGLMFIGILYVIGGSMEDWK